MMKPLYGGLAFAGVLPAAFGYAAAAPANVSATPEAMALPVWNFHHEQLLGTAVQISLRAASRTDADRAEAAALATMDHEEAILSAWKPTSEFSRWSKTRFEPVPISQELFDVLAAFDSWRTRTGGALDPSVEAATQLWQRATSEGRTPTDTEIAQVREAIRQPHWSLDAEQHTATRLSDTPLALASFVKSRILEQAAQAALAAGASGVLINAGGDVVARGAITQLVTIADPTSAADNAPAIDAVLLQNRAVATSGGARRGFRLNNLPVTLPGYSHLIDPRTAYPVEHVLSSTVIAHDAEAAGALATAFAVLPVEQSRALAARLPQVDYMLVLADGSRVSSEGWANHSLGSRPWLQQSVLVTKTTPSAGLWNPHYELALQVNLPHIDDARYRRPFVAVWIEDADHYPVRTLALWANNARWLPDLKRWYRDDQIRSLSEGSDISHTVGSATRPAGQYNLLWDGKDNQGKPVKAGTYTVCIEAVREHGGYQLQQHTINFSENPVHAQLNAGQELGTILLDYRKRK